MTVETPNSETKYSYPMEKDRSCPFQPPPLYAQLREEEPVTKVRLYDGREAWLFTRYDDIRTVLQHPNSSDDTSRPEYPFLSPPGAGPRSMERAFLRMDDPEHARRRRMFAPFFTIRRIEEMRPVVKRRIAELIDGMLEVGPPVDFVEKFALALPSSVACELLGVPYEDHEFFEERFAITSGNALRPPDKQRSTEDGSYDEEAAKRVSATAASELRDYIDRLITSKYDHPTPDLLGTLVTDYVKTGQLSHESAVGEAYILLLAGHETTANSISLGTLILLEHPDQLAMLRDDKSLITLAIEEILRYANVTQMAGVRYAVADFEVAGQEIKAGDAIMAPVASANRDASAFPDPEVFDITRKARHHLVFSFGIHQCLGQPLARLELQEVFTTLFDRIPTMRLAIPFQEVPFKFYSLFYGLHSLPITWT